jgi:hypothetical protein
MAASAARRPAVRGLDGAPTRRKSRCDPTDRVAAGYIITSPPSTASTWPVMNAASSLARKATAWAISSVVPNRPSGVLEVISAWRASGRSWVSSVRTKPGATALQVIPRDASSRAVAFVRPMRPAFAAE